MHIDKDKCIGCGICVPYCPVEAIIIIDKKAEITEKCVECGTCGRINIVHCPTKAIQEDNDVYERPKSVSKFFSDPMAYHPQTKVPGRGTEEVKTNDVTGRVKKGEVGIGIEIGRPSVGADFLDVEKIATALAELDYMSFEKDNPISYHIKDKKEGKVYDDLRERRVISAIIEFTIPIDKMEEVLDKVLSVSETLNTVFTLETFMRLENNNIPEKVEKILANLNLHYRPNSKINLGLGRPIKEI